MDEASHALPSASGASSSDKRRGRSRWQKLGSVSLVGCLVGIVVLFGVVLDQRGQLERLGSRLGDLEAEPLRTATNDVLLRRKKRQATFNSGGKAESFEDSYSFSCVKCEEINVRSSTLIKIAFKNCKTDIPSEKFPLRHFLLYEEESGHRLSSC